MYLLKRLIASISGIRVSLQINFLLVLLFCSVLISGYIAINQLRIFSIDAVTINNFGIIRGSIQRISKQELAGLSAERLITRVDKLIVEEKSAKFLNTPHISKIYKKKFNQEIKQLENSWNELKRLIYQKGKNQKLKDTLYYQSEICWDHANKVVYSAQKISEKKYKNYKKILIKIILFVGLFILGIIVLVYKIVHKRLEVDAITDPLTKLYNRSYFDKTLLKQRRLSSRYLSTFSLLLIDVDFFKNVNDDFGHQKGDAILIMLAQLLLKNSREHDYIFRYGGEEFALILPHTEQANAEIMAEKYRKLVSENDFGLNRELTVSIGVSQFAKDESIESLIRRVDSALYQAKSQGRNKVVSNVHQSYNT